MYFFIGMVVFVIFYECIFIVEEFISREYIEGESGRIVCIDVDVIVFIWI